jgi:alpha-ketoglutarate-dependent 2,4-dichlorophenoxyacetate dioxygenase
LAISIRQLRPNFAGEVTGLDCRKPLSLDEVAAIHAGMDQYAVLVFRDQKLSDQEQLRFTLYFGALEKTISVRLRKPAAVRLGTSRPGGAKTRP